MTTATAPDRPTASTPPARRRRVVRGLGLRSMGGTPLAGRLRRRRRRRRPLRRRRRPLHPRRRPPLRACSTATGAGAAPGLGAGPAVPAHRRRPPAAGSADAPVPMARAAQAAGAPHRPHATRRTRHSPALLPATLRPAPRATTPHPPAPITAHLHHPPLLPPNLPLPPHPRGGRRDIGGREVRAKAPARLRRAPGRGHGQALGHRPR